MSKREIASELHGPTRKTFVRRHVNVYGKNDLWQADLVEMIPYAKKNKNYKYILCVIDCFTKFAWAVPLKTKTAVETAGAMAKILSSRTTPPRLLQVDDGKEFHNKTFDALMAKYKIKKYSTFSTMKACIVERFNRTLKSNIFREFTARGSHDWLSVLPSAMSIYNLTKHRTIGMSPTEADEHPESVTLKLWRRRGDTSSRSKKIKLGDKVRISTYKGVFTKGYLPNWSTEIFTVVKINKTVPLTYLLEDYAGKPIAGCFYTEEIRKTRYPDDYLIEKIIRKKRGEVYVKWLGFDNSHNSWIRLGDIRT